MSAGLGGAFQLVAAAWWFATGASQVTVNGAVGVRSCTVNAVTKELRFRFDGNLSVNVEDNIVVSPGPGATHALTGTILNIGGELFASVEPIGAATLNAGSFIIFRTPLVTIVSTVA